MRCNKKPDLLTGFYVFVFLYPFKIFLEITSF